MAQVCDGYTSNCLMGNWYEEKFAPEQPLRTNNVFQPVQQLDPNISFADAFGNLLPLERMRRAQPWNTSGLVQDCAKNVDGKTTINHLINKTNVDMLQRPVDHRSLTKKYLQGSELNYPKSNPFHLQVKSSAALKVFSEVTKSEMRKDRIVDTQTFRSTLRPNCAKRDQFIGQTTYGAFFNVKQLPPIEGDTIVQRPMVGEKFKESTQPKDNTAVQRSWLQSGDLGLHYCSRSKLPTAVATAAKESLVATAQPTFRRQCSEITLHQNQLMCYR